MKCENKWNHILISIVKLVEPMLYNINIKKEVDETDRQSETRSRRIQTTKKIVILWAWWSQSQKSNFRSTFLIHGTKT